MDSCFFCHPETKRILHSSQRFYALLGLGPIVEGYSILVAQEHIRSMLDLPQDMRGEYEKEKKRLMDLLLRTYGPTIITEHGRVQACFADDQEAHDHHCYHAHQLFFPLPPNSSVSANLKSISREGPFVEIFTGSSLFDMDAASLTEEDEYLYFEDTSGQITVYKVMGKCPRQYMRYLVARSLGRPELADWRTYPGTEKIEAALQALRPTCAVHA